MKSVRTIGFTIGALARSSGVKITTIRYYESIALIGAPARSASGQRLYDHSAVERLNFVRHARDLGFPLDAIRELISLSSDKNRSCANIDLLARRHVADIRHRIKRLRALEREIDHTIKKCAAGAVADCHVLAALSNHALCADVDHGSRPQSVLAAGKRKMPKRAARLQAPKSQRAR